jgi:hypothetical protein
MRRAGHSSKGKQRHTRLEDRVRRDSQTHLPNNCPRKNVRPGVYGGERINHYRLLRTIEEA